MGYVPETPQTYEFLTGVEYLDFIADMYSSRIGERKERIDQFLEGLQMKGHENELIGGYSQGMKQKIAIIAALLHRPEDPDHGRGAERAGPALGEAGQGPPQEPGERGRSPCCSAPTSWR